MEGDPIYEYIDRIIMELPVRAKTIIEEIRRNGKSQSTDNILRTVHSIVVSINQQVNAAF